MVIVSGCLQFLQTISLFGFIHSNLYGNKIKITYSKNSLEISMSFRNQKKKTKKKCKIKCNSTYINLEVKNIKYQFKLARGKEFSQDEE